MATLTTLIAAALVRLGLQVSKERGWYPSSYYVKSALDALRADDMDRAIDEIRRGWREAPGEEALVAREVILMRLDAESERIAGKEATAQKLRDAATGEITLLELRLQRLRFAYDARRAWIAGAVAAIIVVLTILAIVRFDLHPAIAGIGLALVAAVAAIVVASDRKQQRAAFETTRTRAEADVAEEIRILRAEIEMRESEMARAQAERERLASFKNRLPAAG